MGSTTAVTTASSSSPSVEPSSTFDTLPHDSTVIFKCHSCTASFHVSSAHVLTKMGSGQRLTIWCPRSQCNALVCHSSSLPVQESSSLPADWKEGTNLLSKNAPGMYSLDNFPEHPERTGSMDVNSSSPRDSMHYSDSIALLKGPGPSELDVIAGVGGAFDTTNQRRSSGSTTDSTRATSPLAVGVRKGSAGSLSLVGADMVHSIAGVYGAPVTESPRNSVLGEGNLRKLAVQNNMSFVNVGRPTLRAQTMESTSTSVSRRNSDFVEDEHNSSSSPSRSNIGLEDQQDATPEVIPTSETPDTTQISEASPVNPRPYPYLARSSSSSLGVTPAIEEKEDDRQPDLEVASAVLQNIVDTKEHVDDAPPSTPVLEENNRTRGLQRFKRFMSKVVKFVTKRRIPGRGRGKGKEKKKQKEGECTGKGKGKGKEGQEARGYPGSQMLDVPDLLAGLTLVPPSPARSARDVSLASTLAPPSTVAGAVSRTPVEETAITNGPSQAGAMSQTGAFQGHFAVARPGWEGDMAVTVGGLMREVQPGTTRMVQMEVTPGALAVAAETASHP